MSVKRKEKQEKRKKKRIKLGVQSTKPRADVTKKPHNPYSNYEAVTEDVDLMQIALEKHYGKMSDDFVPPIFKQDGEGLKMCEWVGTLRDLMLEKYTDMAIVEPKLKFLITMLATSATEVL